MIFVIHEYHAYRNTPTAAVSHLYTVKDTVNTDTARLYDTLHLYPRLSAPLSLFLPAEILHLDQLVLLHQPLSALSLQANNLHNHRVSVAAQSAFPSL